MPYNKDRWYFNKGEDMENKLEIMDTQIAAYPLLQFS